jgi:hypothetical protein
MIGVDPNASWMPIILILSIGIASITLGSMNLQYWWGELMLWFGIAEFVLSVIIAIFVFGNKLSF